MLGLNGEEDGARKEPIASEDQEQEEDDAFEGGHSPALGGACIEGPEGLSGKMSRAMSITSEDSVEVITDPYEKKNSKNEVINPKQAE